MIVGVMLIDLMARTKQCQYPSHTLSNYILFHIVHIRMISIIILATSGGLEVVVVMMIIMMLTVVIQRYNRLTYLLYDS